MIDLYYQHRVDPNTPIEDTVGAMAGLIQFRQGPFPRPVRSRIRHDPTRPAAAGSRYSAPGMRTISR